MGTGRRKAPRTGSLERLPYANAGNSRRLRLERHSRVANRAWMQCVPNNGTRHSDKLKGPGKTLPGPYSFEVETAI